MRNRVDFRKFAKIFGIEKLYKIPNGKFTGTTVVAESGGRNVTVSEILKTTGFLKDFIEANFDVHNKKYSETLFVLKTLNYWFNNLCADTPTREQMHYAVDVIHEIENMKTNDSNRWHMNAEIATVLNVMIDWFSPANEK